jgi:hypothetical protein
MKSKRININNLLMQNSISAELEHKFSYWRQLRDEIGELSDRFESIVESEWFRDDFDNEYYRSIINEIEKEFHKKQSEFYNLSTTLRVICVNPIYLN